MDDEKENTIVIDTNAALGTLPGLGSQGLGSSFGNVTINSLNTANNIWGSGSSIYYSSPSNTQWTTAPYITTAGSNGSSGIQVKGDAEFEGKVMINGRDISKLFERIEDRLAILMEPSPEKLEKFAALKKAYDNYKLLEKLIGDDVPDDER
jgi:hypothetical protein